MSHTIERFKNIYNARLLKNYGSWIYCNKCNNTVGYLCYTTYAYFRFDFVCHCGCIGYVELGEKTEKARCVVDELIVKKNRKTCHNDESPLFSVVAKNIKDYGYIVECKACNSTFSKSITHS